VEITGVAVVVGAVGKSMVVGVEVVVV